MVSCWQLTFTQIHINDRVSFTGVALGWLRQSHISIVITDLAVMGIEYIKGFASPLSGFQVVFEMSLDERYH